MTTTQPPSPVPSATATARPNTLDDSKASAGEVTGLRKAVVERSARVIAQMKGELGDSSRRRE